ncbi:hypothetical protein EFK50_16470 [Nocardioides marmoriginsengisoli]|uniref:ABM domain-containing protein n=1 Tax=Nocardioides marmoriginsengisoli TaxID=661483 RepID=A0A3N0CIK9_9ACTN|nr:hypothetical protein [Nocardioides marmoriginsengisoli]RNL63282.1 hypothetical protein EFK50_16470 [Nocardioides marmoriginsengisoli]
MYAVINTLTLSRPLDTDLLRRAQSELMSQARSVVGFVQASLISLDEHTVVIVAICDSPQSLRQLQETVGSAWVSKNLTPQLERADRRHGPVIASTLF